VISVLKLKIYEHNIKMLKKINIEDVTKLILKSGNFIRMN
jgi:hypothetical protein